jgi:hypothetical protein
MVVEGERRVQMWEEARRSGGGAIGAAAARRVRWGGFGGGQEGRGGHLSAREGVVLPAEPRAGRTTGAALPLRVF